MSQCTRLLIGFLFDFLPRSSIFWPCFQFLEFFGLIPGYTVRISAKSIDLVFQTNIDVLLRAALAKAYEVRWSWCSDTEDDETHHEVGDPQEKSRSSFDELRRHRTCSRWKPKSRAVVDAYPAADAKRDNFDFFFCPQPSVLNFLLRSSLIKITRIEQPSDISRR